MKFGTKAIHAGQQPDPTTGAIMTPVYLTSTYVQDAPAQPRGGHDYSRTINPTRTALEANLAALENGKWGLTFASGMSAINTVLNLLEQGDHVVASNDLYGGSYRIFTTVYQKYGLTFDFVNTSDLAEVEKAIKPNTKMIYVETPTNPLLSVSDLEGIAKIAQSKNILTVCDNTFATPYIQNPLDLGFDLALHSTTKYLGGHSDVVGGALLGNDSELQSKLKHYQNAVGPIPGPMDCFLVLRSTKTLHVRMQRHCENARQIASFLSEHSKVKKIFYPGDPNHPQHDIAKKQMRAFGGMISFEVTGTLDQSAKVVSSTKLFSLAESLGGVESLIEHPASMTHASIPKSERQKIGLEDGLIRLSVGIEDVEDLIQDLDQALNSY